MSGTDFETEYQKWLTSPAVSEEMKKELSAMAGDEEERKLRFAAPLSFGTAGLRGIMGAGRGMMNVHTVAHATQGLSDEILARGGGPAVIAYDTRNQSRLFAETAAGVLAGNGIPVYLFDGPRPTPELSFAVRELRCAAGVNITASHNPKEYNGYKAYGPDGAQIGPEQAAAVSAAMASRDIFTGVKRISCEKAARAGLLTVIGAGIDEKYMDRVLAQSVNRGVIALQADMKIVYTPLHGTGYRIVPEVLRRAGLKHLLIVPEQESPDGGFPTVRYPNPEFPEAFRLADALAAQHGCDLIIATDPDADRTGIHIRSGDSYIGLTGNQIGCLLLDYIITALRGQGGIPSDAYAVKSIVTTELASVICRAAGVRMYDVLTGFKFIGEVIKNHEERGEGTFLLGFEESYGYLKGTYARDKDAVVASLLITEMAAFYRARGLTLKDALDGLYRRFGFFAEATDSVTVPGADGKEKMASLMASLRRDRPGTLAGEPVRTVRDYLTGVVTDVAAGTTAPTGLPVSDVLYFTTENTVLVIRPSGTEPKIKCYTMAKGKDRAEAEARLKVCREAAAALLG